MAGSKTFEYFVVIAEMRTGSNLFESILNRLEGAECYGELFNPGFVGYPKKKIPVNCSLDERDSDPIALIEALRAHSPKKLIGFRLFSGHDDRVLHHCLADEACAKIILTRDLLESFVSLQLAQKTDQWKMGDAHRKIDAQIEFDANLFKTYLDEAQMRQAEISQILQMEGQAAFQIDYQDLLNIGLYNGLAKFLGINEQLKEIGDVMGRQNPEALKDKVSNYQDMQQSLLSLGLDARNMPTRPQAEMSARAKDILYCASGPIFYAPIGQAKSASVMSAWLALHGDIETGLTGGDLQRLLSHSGQKQVVTVLDHPLDRAFCAFFNRVIFAQTEHEVWARRYLAKHYDVQVPDLLSNAPRKEWEDKGFGAQELAKAFENFLGFLHKNLLGQTKIKINEDWQLQHQAIAKYANWLQPHHIIAPQLQKDICAQIESALGLPHIPIPEIKENSLPFTLAEIYNPNMERLARKAYAPDYRRFSFENYSA